MVSRGFRHAHDYLPEPKFLRFKTEQTNDLLPWADPYIASLFNALEDETSQENRFGDAAEDDIDTPQQHS